MSGPGRTSPDKAAPERPSASTTTVVGGDLDSSSHARATSIKNFLNSLPEEGRIERDRSLFDLFPAPERQHEVQGQESWHKHGRRLWHSPHTADCYLVIPLSKDDYPLRPNDASGVRPYRPSEDVELADQIKSPMSIANLIAEVHDGLSPSHLAPTFKRARRESWDNGEAERKDLGIATVAADEPSQTDIPSAKRRAIIADMVRPPEASSSSESLLAPASPSHSSAGTVSGDDSLKLPAQSDAIDAAFRLYRVHESIIIQCQLLRDLLRGGASAPIASQPVRKAPPTPSPASPPTSTMSSQCWPLCAVLATSEAAETVSSTSESSLPPPKQLPKLSPPTILPSIPGLAQKNSRHQLPTPSAAVQYPQSDQDEHTLLPFDLFRPPYESKKASEPILPTTVYLPVPDAETVSLLLHYLYHHDFHALAGGLGRQSTASYTAAMSKQATEARNTNLSADASVEDQHACRLIEGLIANFDHLGIDDPTPRAWLAKELHRLRPPTSEGQKETA